jgi:hypothetical protein
MPIHVSEVSAEVQVRPEPERSRELRMPSPASLLHFTQVASWAAERAARTSAWGRED